MRDMRIIAHLDMDAFFAAVEERDKPYLTGCPIVVGADPKGGRGRGVVSTASYKAREYGIHSAMPISRAWRFSEEAKQRGAPEAVFIVPKFHRYGETSSRIRAIIEEHADAVEQASVDEFYIDLSSAGSFAKAEVLGRELKELIREKEKLTCSIGVGPNKLVAKIASDFRKPDGLTVVPAVSVEAFLAPFPVRKIPGVGPKSEADLARKGIRTVRDAVRMRKEELVRMFGTWGSHLYEKVRGVDGSPLVFESTPKSVGAEETFDEDTLDMKFLLARLGEIAKDVHARLRKEGFSMFRTIVLRVRFDDFETHTRSQTLPEATASFKDLEKYSLSLLFPFLDRQRNPKKKKIRLLGIRVEKLGRGTARLPGM